jgi:hypothetical protein
MNKVKNLLLVGILSLPALASAANNNLCGDGWLPGNLPGLTINGQPVFACYYNQANSIVPMTFQRVPSSQTAAISQGAAALIKALNPNVEPQYISTFNSYIAQVQNAFNIGQVYFGCSVMAPQSNDDTLYLRGSDGKYYIFFTATQNNVPGPVAQANLKGLGNATCGALK